MALKILVIGLEPILLIESNFKSDVYTNFTKQAKINIILYIPQFDLLTIEVQFINLIIIIIGFYYYNLKYIVPYYIEIKKFRNKKNKKEKKLITNFNIDAEKNLLMFSLKCKLFFQN